MKKDKIIILLILSFAILFIGASALYNNLKDKVKHESLVTGNDKDSDKNDQETSENPDDTDKNDTPKQPAPNFTVFDIDGNEIHLVDFKGKPVIINFWASWCGPCKNEMPDFEKVYQKYKEDIHFMFINITDGHRETIEKASSYITKQGYTFPVYYDTKLSASSNYNTSSIPATYFIDAEGNLVAWAQGSLNSSVIQQGIDMLFEALPND